MIPFISLMVGLYIITRMANLLIDKHKETSVVTSALAILTMIAAGYAIYYCLVKGGEVARLLK
jgi:hypothetical protein